jgi:hypothetical protein
VSNPWSTPLIERPTPAPKRPKEPSEHQEQKAFVQWFGHQFSGVRILSIPNGAALAGDGLRRAMQMGRLRAEGLSPGAPDLFVPAWLLWVEMKKANGGVVSDEQAEWHEYLRGIGHTVIVGRGFEDATRQVQDFKKFRP